MSIVNIVIFIKKVWALAQRQLGPWTYGQADRMAHKLSATKI